MTGIAHVADDGRTDAGLIAAWNEGDEGAARDLVRRHTPALARFLAGAGAQEDLDDLVQETFLRAFRRLASYRGDASFRTWLMAIGSNALKDAHRQRSRRVVLSLDGREVVGGADPQAEAERTEAEDRLARAVRRLSRMQRDVFLLRAQQGASYEDIAEALQTSVGAARVHYHHAVKRLKEVLA